jgi:hypothetical protein
MAENTFEAIHRHAGMSDENALVELLSRWEQEHAEGRDVPVAKLCSARPELAAELERRIAAVRQMQALAQVETAPATADRASFLPVGSPTATLQLPSFPGYQTERELGRGGMGVVYRVLDLRRREAVALKTLQRLDADSLYRFKQEFRALAGIAHPNLVSLYELASNGEIWFFTMELVEGIPFTDYVRMAPDTEKAGAGFGRLRTALRHLSEGVTALHVAGRMHRDIKPSNALVTGQGRVVLLDFGLVAQLGPGGLHQSTEPHLLGTVAYMAPEQAASMPVNPAADWYSVGVVLYEALTGRLPFRGPMLKVLQEKQHCEPPPPRALVPTVPDDLNDLCVELLRRLPQDRPSGADVLECLGRSRPAPLSGCTAAGESLLGRERHLAMLEDAYTAARQRRAILVTLHGPSGVGKSALVRHFLDGLRERGVVVLAGQCYEHESAPYKALDPVVDELGRYLRGLPRQEVEVCLPRDLAPLTRVFPVLGRAAAVAEAADPSAAVTDAHELRRRAFAGLRELLGRLGDRRRLVLHIDDLQWGDVDSALLLADLLAPPAPPPLLLLTCYRSEDAGNPCLHALTRVVDAVEHRDLPVEPLTFSETQELAFRLMGSADAVQVETLAQEARGNPFFLTELVREVQSGSGLTGQVSVDRLIRTRVGRLPEEARRLLEIVAVSGRPLAETEASRAAGIADGRSQATFLQASRLLRGTVVGEEGGLETYHDRIREAIVNSLAPEKLRNLHWALAVALEESGRSDPEYLAAHFEAAGEPCKAGVYYAGAARRAAAALAFDRAAELFQLAVTLRPVGEAEGRELRAELGDTLANAGRGAASAEAYLAAAQGAAAGKALELRRRAADQFLLNGNTREGLEVLSTLLAEVGLRLAGGPRRALLSLLLERYRLRMRGLEFRERSADAVPPDELLRVDVCYTASKRLTMLDVAQSALFHTRHLRLALQAGEPSRVAQGLANEVAHSALGGGRRQQQTEAILRKAQELADRLEQPYIHALVTAMTGVAAWGVGRWKEGLALCDRAERMGTEKHIVGFFGEKTKLRHFALDCLMLLGEWREIGRRIPAYLKDARTRNDPFSASVMLVHSYVPCLAAGRAGDAEAVTRQALLEWPQEGYFMVSHWALFGQTEAALYAGEGPRAAALMSREWPSLRRSSFVEHIQFLFLLFLHLRARTSLAAAAAAPVGGWLFGKRASLVRSALRDARTIERAGMPWATPLARLIRAGAAALRGERDVRAALAVAEEECSAADMCLYAFAARRRRGQLLGGEEGRALMVSADAGMMGQDIREPARIAAMLIPGFPD